MKKSDLVINTFAVFDILIGAGSILFLLIVPLFSSDIKALPVFSSVFIISIAFPLLILVMGITILMRLSWSYTLSLFIAFLIMINAFAALLSLDPPVFLNENAPHPFVFFFRSFLPGAALAYFGLHLFSSYFYMKSRKQQTLEKPPEPALSHPEFFCARCNQALKPSDSICPSCGALIKGMLCGTCGFEGKEEDFIDKRCPRCGEALAPEQKE